MSPARLIWAAVVAAMVATGWFAGKTGRTSPNGSGDGSGKALD